jgi:minimal PKS acyl carrier protein
MSDTRLTIDDLKRILLAAAGADEGIDLGGDIRDVPFDQLGYDSLALLETSSRIQREYGVELDDDAFLAAQTPEALIEAVNERLAAHA